MFRLANDEILDAVTLAEFIEQHRILKDHRYVPLMAAYRTNYPIFTQPPKPEFKPDKRIAVNFAKIYCRYHETAFLLGCLPR